MNARLFVLGLLSERPQHGYDLYKWLKDSLTELWAEVLPGSIYHALRQMEKEGLVEMQQTEQVGRRTRAIYAITLAGQTELTQLLQRGWESAPRSFPMTLYTLLTFSQHLPPAEIGEALMRQIERLEQELALWQEGETLKEEMLPTWGQAVFKNGCSHLEADLQLLRTLQNLF